MKELCITIRVQYPIGASELLPFVCFAMFGFLLGFLETLKFTGAEQFLKARMNFFSKTNLENEHKSGAKYFLHTFFQRALTLNSFVFGV